MFSARLVTALALEFCFCLHVFENGNNIGSCLCFWKKRKQRHFGSQKNTSAAKMLNLKRTYITNAKWNPNYSSQNKNGCICSFRVAVILVLRTMLFSLRFSFQFSIRISKIQISISLMRRFKNSGCELRRQLTNYISVEYYIYYP